MTSQKRPQKQQYVRQLSPNTTFLTQEVQQKKRTPCFYLKNVQGGSVFSFCLLLENHLWIMHLGHCKGIVAQKHRVTSYYLNPVKESFVSIVTHTWAIDRLAMKSHFSSFFLK